MYDQLHHQLKRHHYSRTPQRDAVYSALRELGPCRASQLTTALAGRVDKASVYRALDLFARAGIAIDLGNKQFELGDAFKQHHHHFTCTHCGRSFGFEDAGLEDRLEAFAAARGFQLSSHQIELAGLCASCQPAAT